MSFTPHSSVTVRVGQSYATSPLWKTAYPRRWCKLLRRTAPIRVTPPRASRGRLKRRRRNTPVDGTHRHRDRFCCVGLPHQVHGCREVSARTCVSRKERAERGIVHGLSGFVLIRICTVEPRCVSRRAGHGSAATCITCISHGVPSHELNKEETSRRRARRWRRKFNPRNSAIGAIGIWP